MRDVVRVLLQILATSPAWAANAGTLYRCDDGGSAAIYQTLPCAAHQRTIEQREYLDVPAVNADARPDIATVAARPSRREPKAPSTRRPRATPSAPDAFVCSQSGREWVQEVPCGGRRWSDAGGGSGSKALRQVAIDRDEACRRIRDGSDRGAAGERPSDSAYRRNLLRDRSGC